MGVVSQFVLEIDPEAEDIVDREIIRELTEGAGTVESTASRLRRDEATIKRRMGTILIRLLTTEAQRRRA